MAEPLGDVDLVMQRGEKSAQLVLRSSDAGFLHCRAPIIQCGDAYFVRFGEETIVNEVRFNFVGTLSDWKVASAEPVPLAELPANVEPPHAGFIALRFRKPETLLKAAARVGFRGLGVVHLRRLFQQEVPPRPGSRPKSEVAFVDALVRHVFPGCDDGFVEVALQARNPDWSSMWRESSPIFENRFRDEVLDEGDFELAEIKQEYEREMAKVKAQKAATEKKLSTLWSSRRGGGAVAVPGAGHPRHRLLRRSRESSSRRSQLATSRPMRRLGVRQGARSTRTSRKTVGEQHRLGWSAADRRAMVQGRSSPTSMR